MPIGTSPSPNGSTGPSEDRPPGNTPAAGGEWGGSCGRESEVRGLGAAPRGQASFRLPSATSPAAGGEWGGSCGRESEVRGLGAAPRGQASFRLPSGNTPPTAGRAFDFTESHRGPGNSAAQPITRPACHRGKAPPASGREFASEGTPRAPVAGGRERGGGCLCSPPPLTSRPTRPSCRTRCGSRCHGRASRCSRGASRSRRARRGR